MIGMKKTRLPNSEWHIEREDRFGTWRVYPPGNVAHLLLGAQWDKKQAYAIAALIERAYEHGAADVRDAIKEVLKIGEL